MRYLVKFTKESDIKFISHLDTLRTMQRTIRRSGLPIEYSKGFNPHMILSIAQPLSVGVYSCGEYIDMNLKEEVDEKVMVDKLNLSAPRGIKFLDSKKVIRKTEKKVPPAMALVEAATYSIDIVYKSTEELEEGIEELFKLNTWDIVKKSKKGPKNVDIKPLLMKFDYKIEGNLLKIETLVSCGSKANLSAQILSKFIMENTKDSDKDKFVRIQRKELFTYKDKKLVSLLNYFD